MVEMMRLFHSRQVQQPLDRRNVFAFVNRHVQHADVRDKLPMFLVHSWNACPKGVAPPGFPFAHIHGIFPRGGLRI